MSVRHFSMVVILVILPVCSFWAQASEPALPTTGSSGAAASPSTVMTNADVVAMSQAGLDEAVIIEKIRHSDVAFDTSTKGLIELKEAKVSSAVVKAMIDRPQGPPVVYAPSAPAPAAQLQKSEEGAQQAKPFDKIEKIRIRADSEVLRVAMEEKLRELHGPAVSNAETDYDATLSFATDCGAQTISMWSGANFCTCEGSMTLDSAGYRLYTNQDRERSANAAKASKKMAERMIEKFVSAWKHARAKK